MRILGIGEYNDLAAMYHGMVQRGHEVRVHVADPACRDVFEGMLDFAPDWEQELGWVRGRGDDADQGLIIFESAIHGSTQDALRRDGFKVIGGSELGDRLEADRLFGQSALSATGMTTAPSLRFTDFRVASDHVRSRPGRYVLKFNGADSERSRNFIGEMEDGADMLALLGLYASRASPGQEVDFVLMEHLQGVEVGIGAYFNGHEFLEAACIDFEHKRFFPGELGELTGEMGTIVSYRGSCPLFERVLAPLAGMLRDGGYCGYINVNLIANEAGLWPLEFTSRFGYPGFAICEALHVEPWDVILRRMAGRDTLALPTHDGFASGVVLTVPPFPYRHGYAQLSKGLPVCLRKELDAPALRNLHFAEVAFTHGQLVTSGSCGYVGVATGVGATVQAANKNALAVARGVVVPNLRYRTDIGERVARDHIEKLAAWGWLGH